MIIDFHTHYFPDALAPRAIASLQRNAHTAAFADGTLSGLKAAMARGQVDRAVTLPVATASGQVEKLNTRLLENREALEQTGIIPFGAIHPDTPSPEKVLRTLKENGIRGIKLHPAFQGGKLNDIRFLRIIGAAEELELITMTHAGVDIGMWQCGDCADIEAVLQVVRQIGPRRLVLAHMGGWNNWDLVEKELAGAPLWFDTSFSTGPILPDEPEGIRPIVSHNMTGERFARLVRALGADRILFGTDSPWDEPAAVLERIRNSGLNETELSAILYRNAESLLERR